MVSLNVVVVTVIFLVVLIILAIFVAQQISTVKKIQENKPMTLSEKL